MKYRYQLEIKTLDRVFTKTCEFSSEASIMHFVNSIKSQKFVNLPGENIYINTDHIVWFNVTQLD